MRSGGVRFCSEQLVLIPKRIFSDSIHNLKKGETVSLPYFNSNDPLIWVFDLFTGLKRVFNLICKHGAYINRL